ncbi:MAG TPA: OmpA family protein [Burkholderiales bacterium]|nr:OmpA family protein [Burkholderiales bacterium]
MSRTLRNLVALSCVLMTGQALAADSASDVDSRFYISPSVNATATDKDWGTNNGLGFGIGIGKAVSESWNLELNGNYTDQSLKSGNHLQNLGYDVDAMYFFSRNPTFSPFVEAGVGGVHTRVYSNSQDNFAGNVGIGFMKWMNDIAFRADLRYRRVSDVNSYLAGTTGTFSPSDWIASVGLVIPLGPKPVPPAPAPAPEPAPAPAPAPQEAPPPPPAPEPVEIPRPVAHSKIVLEGTHFAFNKATLRPDGKEILDENAKALNKYPDINVEIAGYTDSTGPAKYNLKLSKARAETVKKYLESKGIAANRMTIKGFGEKHPIASNKTKAGRAKNRRVEIEILN